MLWKRGVVLEHVEPQRPRGVAGIKIDHVLDAVARDKAHYGIHELAMRINDADPSPRLDVLANHILQKYRFAGSGLSDGIEVAPPVIVHHIDILFLPAEKIVSEQKPFERHTHRGRGLARFQLLHFRRIKRNVRKMENARKLFGI